MEKQNNLIDFERVRSGLILFNGQWTRPAEPVVIVPPKESNSFYEVGNGEVQLYTLRDDLTDYRFDLYINREVETGVGSFSVNGDISNISQPYRNLYLRENSTLIINSNLTISKGTAIFQGNLVLSDLTSFIASDKAEVIFTETSKLIIPENGFIFANTGASIKIYGTVEVHISKVNLLLQNDLIEIDSQAYINITGLDLSEKEYSVMDLLKELNLMTINPNTVNERNFNNKRITFKWIDGSPLNNSAVVSVSTEVGEISSGDFKLSILGVPNTVRPNLKIFSDLVIEYGSKFYVSENFNNATYYYPALYIGAFIENANRPGTLTIDGELIVDGPTSQLLVDRNGKIIISSSGLVRVQNEAQFKSTSNTQVILEISGTLIIDSLSQLSGFEANQIRFKDNGKIIILNSTENDGPVLLSVPNGIQESELFRLFKNRLTHIEFHIPNKKGIKVDQNFESFYQEMKYWYGPYRLEKAVRNKYIVWEDGGFIEFNNEIIPWITIDSNLYDLNKIFISEGRDQKEQLQSIINHFKFAGFGEVVFKFVEDDAVKEIKVSFRPAQIRGAYFDTESESLVIQSTKIGNLYLTNNISKRTPEIIALKARRQNSLLPNYNYIRI